MAEVWQVVYRFALIYMCVAFNCLIVRSEDRSGENLVQFPHDLTYGHISHVLDDNNILTVDYIEPMAMTEITINNNLLQAFPDFSNNTDLTKIGINDNRLTSIPYDLLDILVNLKILEVMNNQLTSFPDPPGPGNTLWAICLKDNQLVDFPSFANLGRSLTFLNMKNNDISRAPVDKLAHLVVMEDLNLSDNRLYESTNSVPDIRVMPNINKARFKSNQLSQFDVSMMASVSGMTFYLENNDISKVGNFFHHARSNLSSNTLRLAGNPLDCDCQMKWLKLAHDLRTPTFVTDVTCATPAALVGRELGGISLEELVCPVENGLRQMRATVQLPTYDVPLYPVASAHEVRSIVQCVQKCVDQGNCLVYGYVLDTQGWTENCAITTEGNTTSTRVAPWDDTTAVTWYLME